jgi:hypothetical protein
VTLNREKEKQLKFKISRWMEECNLTDANAFERCAAVMVRVETAVLKMEAAGFFETSVCIYQIVWRRIPKEKSFQSLPREHKISS